MHLLQEDSLIDFYVTNGLQSNFVHYMDFIGLINFTHMLVQFISNWSTSSAITFNYFILLNKNFELEQNHKASSDITPYQ